MTRDDVEKIAKKARGKGEIPDLSGANLRDADLCGADLSRADLRWANLCGANLCGANIDFSCWPLWCGTKEVIVDIKLIRQLLAHVAVLNCADPAFEKIRKAILTEAKECHRAQELGLLNKAKEK